MAEHPRGRRSGRRDHRGRRPRRRRVTRDEIVGAAGTRTWRSSRFTRQGHHDGRGRHGDHARRALRDRLASSAPRHHPPPSPGRGRLVPGAAHARLQLPAHRHAGRAGPRSCAAWRTSSSAATRSPSGTGGARRVRRSSRAAAARRLRHAYHLFVVHHRDGAPARRGSTSACASAGSSPRSTTPRSTATPITARPYGYERGLCPEAERYYAGCLSLPCFPDLTEADQDRVVAAVEAVVDEPPAEFAIGDRPVGPGHPTYVIAEAGANHNRDLGIARDADRRRRRRRRRRDQVPDLLRRAALLHARRRASSTSSAITDKSPAELLEDISLPREWQPELAAYARERGLDFFSTPVRRTSRRRARRARRARDEDRLVRDRRPAAIRAAAATGRR